MKTASIDQELIIEKFIIDSKLLTWNWGLMVNETVMEGMIKKDTEMLFGPSRNSNF